MDAHKHSERTRNKLAPWGFTQQVGAVLRFVQQQVGGEVIVGLAITNVVLWVLLRPPGVAGTMYVDEIFATTAIVLLSCSLVLATRAPFLERFFGGLDCRAISCQNWSGSMANVRLSYDNLSTAVKPLIEGRIHEEQRAFVAFRSYYLFESHFCTPAQGHEKGGVEGSVRFSRRNFLVPLPRVASFEDLNRFLLEQCQR